jgi:glycosyltransferase involved in cell wall biosynthesis
VLDMRRIYSRTGLLLVPSTWEEGFGRVVVEAQMSGIPAVASDRGGLPEAVGDGGVLLDPDAAISAWVDAVQRIWTDRTRCLDLAARARDMAARHHANALRETSSLLTLAMQAAGGRPGIPAP